MKDLGKKKQIICITHLPQIAAKSEKHFIVEKKEENNRTLSSVRELNTEEKLNEIARIMKGDKITDATLEHARELMAP